MRFMGLAFILVAMYRSVFVSRYLYQYGWFDTIANSSLIIRSLAWVAELSFAGLIAFAMLRFNKDMRKNNHGNSVLLSQYERHAPWALITCIFLAQFFATGGLITKSRLLFAIEETLWGVGFFSVLPLAIIQFSQSLPSRTEIKTTGAGHAQDVQCGECRLVLDLLYLCTHIPLANGILGNRPRATGNRNSPNQDRHQCSYRCFLHRKR